MKSNQRSNRIPWTIFLGVVLLSTHLSTVTAQTNTEPRDPSPQDLQAAAAAFESGQRAALVDDHSQAASMFELAYRTVPAAAPLRAAVRHHAAAENSLSAARLALVLESEFDDEASQSLAAEVLETARRALYQINVECAPACSLAVGGLAIFDLAQTSASFFVTPSSRALNVAWDDGGRQTQELQPVAGESVNFHFEAPEPAIVRSVEADTVESVQMPPPEDPSSSSGSGISPAYFALGLVVTAGLGAAAIWSGIDTLNARDEYVSAPTQTGYEDGLDRQGRTNWLIAGTSAAGALTLLLLVLTGFDDDEDEGGAALQPTSSVDLATETLTVGAEGTW